MKPAAPSPFPRRLANPWLGVVIEAAGTPARPEYGIGSFTRAHGSGWSDVLRGRPGEEFVTSLGSAPASACTIEPRAAGGWEIRLEGRGAGWTATGVVTIPADRPVIWRRQTYRFTKAGEVAVRPGFVLAADPALKYTCPLHAHEQPLAQVGEIRPSVDWALPFPFHVWHDGRAIAIYGVDRSGSPGTVEFRPEPDGGARLGVHWPDTATQHPGGTPHVRPGLAQVAAGGEITLTEVFASKALAAGEEPLLEAVRLAAELLLRTPPHPMDAAAVAARIAAFYPRCLLWEPDALGPGRGWFSNMWVRTQTGPAKKRGEMSGYFDFGWGEGIAVEMWMGSVRHWLRTGDRALLPYVDTMTRGMDCFRRGPDGAYYDRSDGRKYGDFLMDHLPGGRIWTHSLGHTGSQLIQLYQLAPNYPDAEVRDQWLAAAHAMGAYLGRLQRPDGDVPDIVDDQDREANRKPHRIAARAVICGLWTRLAAVTGDPAWLDRARRLAAVVAPQLARHEFFNQMLDGVIATDKEYVDGEAACYVLEGLVPLYAATREAAVLASCQQAAAFAFAWTYFYDLPHAHRGIARGGQCCRMDDYPLLYPIGPAKAMEPVLALAAATGDPLYRTMAAEMASFLGNWQLDAPGQPWDGGMVHALGQFSGRHWGPDLAGQIDSGMATGNSLAALECWLAQRPPSSGGFAARGHGA